MRYPVKATADPDAKQISSKDLKGALQAFRVSKRGTIRSDLCAAAAVCTKVRFFVCAVGGHDLLLRRIDAVGPRRSSGAVHESLVRECGRARWAKSRPSWIGGVFHFAKLRRRIGHLSRYRAGKSHGKYLWYIVRNASVCLNSLNARENASTKEDGTRALLKQT